MTQRLILPCQLPSLMLFSLGWPPTSACNLWRSCWFRCGKRYLLGLLSFAL